MKKTICLLLMISLVLQLTACSAGDYLRAKKLLAAGDTEGAAAIFRELGDYRDSRELLYGILDPAVEKALEEHDYSLAAELLWKEEGSYREHMQDAVRDSIDRFVLEFDFSEESCMTAEYIRNAGEAAGVSGKGMEILDAVISHSGAFREWAAYDSMMEQYGSAFSDVYNSAMVKMAKGDAAGAIDAAETILSICESINGIGDARAQDLCADIGRIGDAIIQLCSEAAGLAPCDVKAAAEELENAKKELDEFRARYEEEYLRPKDVILALIENLE